MASNLFPEVVYQTFNGISISFDRFNTLTLINTLKSGPDLKSTPLGAPLILRLVTCNTRYYNNSYIAVCSRVFPEFFEIIDTDYGVLPIALSLSSPEVF